jgi:hypothetical protein
MGRVTQHSSTTRLLSQSHRKERCLCVVPRTPSHCKQCIVSSVCHNLVYRREDLLCFSMVMVAVLVMVLVVGGGGGGGSVRGAHCCCWWWRVPSSHALLGLICTTHTSKVADTDNHAIRCITVDGVVTTLAGSSHEGAGYVAIPTTPNHMNTYGAA